MAHIFVQVPDELYVCIEAAAWRANTTVGDLVAATLKHSFAADIVLDDGPAVDTTLVWAFGAMPTRDAPAATTARPSERFFLDWEVDTPEYSPG